MSETKKETLSEMSGMRHEMRPKKINESASQRICRHRHQHRC